MTTPPIAIGEVTQWKKTLSAINEGRRGAWMHFLSFLRIHRIMAEFCTCAIYSTLGICDGILAWLFVKEPGFMVAFAVLMEVRWCPTLLGTGV